MEIIPNNTPAGAEGDAIRYQWGAWHGSSTDGSPVDQTIADAFQIVKEGTPEGFTAALKINAKKGTSYELRQIVEGLDPDVEYVLRAQVKTEALDGLGASVRAAFLTADKEMIWEVEGASLESKIINGDSGWADLYVKFNMPEGARDLFLAASVKDAGGAAYFTNFELLPAVFYEEPGDDDNSSNPSNPSDGSTPSDGSNPTDDSSDTQGSSEEPEIPETGDRPAVLAILGIAVSAAAVLTAKKRRKA